MQRFKIIIFILFIFVDFSIAQKSLLRSGPMLGYGEMREVMLWVQVNEKAKFILNIGNFKLKIKFKSKSLRQAGKIFYNANRFNKSFARNKLSIRIIYQQQKNKLSVSFKI